MTTPGGTGPSDTPDVSDVEVLLAARGDELVRLRAAAADMRDAGLVAAGRPGQITYSRKVFIPLTRLCRDRCHYCTFVTVPGRLARAGQGAYLEIDEVVEIARQGARLGCKEALFTLGDRPEDRWPAAREWLDARGYTSTIDYVRAAAAAVLAQTGLLPHANPGVMTVEEMRTLKTVAPSMGMMLETTSRRLFEEKGQAHFGSPDKDPAVRLRVLDDAGRVRIPFTTGILVGIGETRRDRAESILAIGAVHRRHGHIQEVIVQNFRAKPDTAMRGTPDAELDEFLAAIAVSRLVLGPDMRVQAPPNLVSEQECRDLIDSGVDDWGGVSPLTPDHVNPERPWPNLDVLAEITAACGHTLTERITAQPPYVLAGPPWIDDGLLDDVAALADPLTGLAGAGTRVHA
ncbi:7,8-didemethyl-8-hydroxy-5-deazariboflavin synthase CofG [Williamsia sterculiae]|nr:7,8-didemethyl-8-hydroxy-5-deazariboflavin synthase CofG [Williamsia sterculiae]